MIMIRKKIRENATPANRAFIKRGWISIVHWRSEEKSPMVRFPDPTILKQLEEWHVIVSCDQLGETFRAAPMLPLP